MSQVAPAHGASVQAWLDYWLTVHVSAIDLGLDRVRVVAEYLAVTTPQAHVVTVAGTNGKGSTTTTIAAIYQAAGFSVGLYQSPHIKVFNERIKLDGEMVTDQALVAAFEQIESARVACGLTLSFFEATTLAAFVLFAHAQCQVWVLEVGLGGRLDAVNVIDPDVAVITNVDLDHVEWLGDTIEKIAFEKAGILRQGIPLIWGDPQRFPDAVCAQAQALGCRVYRAGVHYEALQDGQHFYYSAPACTLRLPHPSLAVVNVATAISAVLAGDLPVRHQHIVQGIEQAKIAGRFEKRTFANRQLILDVAHNVHGMQFLLQQLAALHPVGVKGIRTDSRIHMVFSMLADKDMAGVIARARPVVDQWYVAPMHVARAATLEQLQQQYTDKDSVDYFDHLDGALAEALQRSNAQDLIVVCGSFHVLEAVWEYLEHGS